MSKVPFWETTPLEALTEEQWEALCDGCGRCCLTKIEDQDSGNLFYTNVVCRFHDSERGRCTRYTERSKLVPDCIKVTPQVAREEKWLPGTCAYRLLAEGKPLPEWHPLVSGDRDSVRRAGISVRGKVISERYVHPEELVEHLVHWFD
jgi:hypothetical protein